LLSDPDTDVENFLHSKIVCTKGGIYVYYKLKTELSDNQPISHLLRCQGNGVVYVTWHSRLHAIWSVRTGHWWPADSQHSRPRARLSGAAGRRLLLGSAGQVHWKQG